VPPVGKPPVGVLPVLPPSTIWPKLGLATSPTDANGTDGSSPANIKHDWVSTVYFSIVTFTTTGYGDYRPRDNDRLLAATEALSGYIFLGTFVSLFTSYLTKRDRSNSEKKEREYTG
jgi:hypothetical protein